MWMVPLGNVLAAHGCGGLVPWAFSLGPLCALVSPLFIGALADRRFEAQRLLTILCLVASAFLFLAFFGLGRGWGGTVFLALLAAHQLCFAPTWSLVTAIILTHAPKPTRQFPLLRVWATISWILAGLAVSFVLAADVSPRTGMVAAGMLVATALYAWRMPATPPLAARSQGRARGWRQSLGLDALDAFPKGDLRVFLVTYGLLAAPLAAFYPYAPQFIRALGHEKAAALMTTGQVAETLSMVMLGWFLARWRIKWVFGLGLAFAVLRYGSLAAAAAWPMAPLLVPGIAMHGLIYTFFFVTAQIYVEQRMDATMRARVQALLTTVNGGVGSLVGVLAAGWWHAVCVVPESSSPSGWAAFWGGLCLVVAVVAVYFLVGYRGGDGTGKHCRPVRGSGGRGRACGMRHEAGGKFRELRASADSCIRSMRSARSARSAPGNAGNSNHGSHGF